MKKISTAKEIEKSESQKLAIGLDLGDRWSWYCVLNEAGEVVREQKVATTAKAMKEVFGGMPRSRIALETGTHSPWVSRVLSELGHEVIVAHARNVRLIGESREKDDRLDARMLARLVRIDPQWLAGAGEASQCAGASGSDGDPGASDGGKECVIRGCGAELLSEKSAGGGGRAGNRNRPLDERRAPT
ncbi:MAG: transposase [Terriglobales bacterium]|jgi:hypothetical protein